MTAAAETVIASSTAGKCCGLLRRLSCFRKGFCSNDDEDGSDRGHNIHYKCVLTCCAGRVSDNDFADKNKRGVYDLQNDHEGKNIHKFGTESSEMTANVNKKK